MAEGEGGEKTEQPTGHKLDKARNKGQVPKSQEVTSVVVLLVAFSALISGSRHVAASGGALSPLHLAHE